MIGNQGDLKVYLCTSRLMEQFSHLWFFVFVYCRCGFGQINPRKCWKETFSFRTSRIRRTVSLPMHNLLFKFSFCCFERTRGVPDSRLYLCLSLLWSGLRTFPWKSRADVESSSLHICSWSWKIEMKLGYSTVSWHPCDSVNRWQRSAKIETQIFKVFGVRESGFCFVTIMYTFNFHYVIYKKRTNK